MRTTWLKSWLLPCWPRHSWPFSLRNFLLKTALTRDLPRRKADILQQLKSTAIPPQLAAEFQRFQQFQTLSLRDFNARLAELLVWLEQQRSTFNEKARALVANIDTRQLNSAQQTLFLQRWRLSLTLQTLTLNQQLLDQQRERLLAELQQRLAVSGQLAPVLADDGEGAAGRLWDLSRGALQQGDYQLIVQYGEFLASQPELLKLAQQLGRSREAKAVPSDDTPAQTCHQRVREPANVPEEVSGLRKAMISCACCRRSWQRSASASWRLNSTGGWWRNAC